ncbi:MAG: Rrf2 family transcriptional regulator [Pseudomonadota bacterium]|nr:Rrf2 family transcriptional regulator [Pseudomonadota bacterium]
MLRFSKKALFAIEAVLDIAYYSAGEPVQSGDITRRQGIPRRYLEQALQQLARQGLLVGVRGPNGGYRLARERRRISVGEIVRVVRKIETNDKEADDMVGSELGQQVVWPLWHELQDEVMVRLDATTIDDLCTRANECGINSERRLNLDFAI